jgi:hypothetical protein
LPEGRIVPEGVVFLLDPEQATLPIQNKGLLFRVAQEMEGHGFELRNDPGEGKRPWSGSFRQFLIIVPFSNGSGNNPGILLFIQPQSIHQPSGNQ